MTFDAPRIAVVAAILGAASACASAPDGSGHAPKNADDDTGPPTAGRDGSVYDSTPSPTSGLGVLRFMPEALYSGSDGTHTFKVPVAVYDAASDLSVTASSPSVSLVKTRLKAPAVDGMIDNGQYFMVSVTAPGSYELTATSKGHTAKVPLVVTEYSVNRWAAGESRYLSGSGTSPPCTQCHSGGAAIDHSPAALASLTDGAIATIITTGVKNRTPISAEGGHRWKVTTEEREGLVTYLRALEPRGFE